MTHTNTTINQSVTESSQLATLAELVDMEQVLSQNESTETSFTDWLIDDMQAARQQVLNSTILNIANDGVELTALEELIYVLQNRKDGATVTDEQILTACSKLI